MTSLPTAGSSRFLLRLSGKLGRSYRAVLMVGLQPVLRSKMNAVVVVVENVVLRMLTCLMLPECNKSFTARAVLASLNRPVQCSVNVKQMLPPSVRHSLCGRRSWESHMYYQIDWLQLQRPTCTALVVNGNSDRLPAWSRECASAYSATTFNVRHVLHRSWLQNTRPRNSIYLIMYVCMHHRHLSSPPLILHRRD